MTLLSSKLLLGLSLFVCCPSLMAKELRCPPGTVLIDFTATYDKQRTLFCQVKHDGKLVKHGPELIYFLSGALKEKNYYNFGVKTQRGQVQPVNYKSEKYELESKLKERLDHVFDKIFSNLLGVTKNKEILIYRDSSYCQHSPEERLQFILTKKPYTNTIDFASNCHFKGSLRYDYDKDLKANYEVKNLYSYNQLTFDYLLTNESKNNKQLVTMKITNGKLVGEKESIDFTSRATIELDLQKAMLSEGRSGLTLNELTAEITNVDGAAYSYLKEL